MKTRLLFTMILSGISCSVIAQNAGIPGPHLLVYKTKKDYSKLVPVIMSEDRTKIVSYPDPRDIAKKGKNQVPTSLHGKYLMDNTGIGINTVFLKMTYTQYAKLKTPPSMEELNKMIKERNPLTTLYDCGLKSNYKTPVKQMNNLIDKKQLKIACKLIPLTK